jgi:hypothetical protein
MLDGAFAVTMNQDSTLLGLRVGDAADVNKGFDDIVEGVYVVVV